MVSTARIACTGLLSLVFLESPLLSSPCQQDCNLDGIPDAGAPAWGPYSAPDEVQMFLAVTNQVNVDVLSNDTLAGGYYGGVCLSQVCNNCGTANCGNDDTVIIVNGPQHGSSSMFPNIGTTDHGKIRFIFSNSGTNCGDYEYIVYRWQDQCGMHSPDTRARIRIECPQSDGVLSLNGGGWLRVDDLGPGSAVDLDRPFTIDCWVKPSTSTGVEAIVSKWGDNGLDDRSYVIERWSDGSIQFGVSGDATQNDGAYHTFFSGTLQAGVWQHVACSYDGSFRRTYLNGVLVGIRAATGSVHQGDTHLAIGAKLSSNAQGAGDVSEFFHGQIDRVRLWDRALRVDEVQLSMNVRYLANASSATLGPTPICAWEFDGASGHDSRGLADAFAQGSVSYSFTGGPPNTLLDCDGNGLPDYYDVWRSQVYNLGLDQNQDGILDSCEYASVCGPGTGGTLPCPCSNPPATAGVGCDNSSATGGARLQAAGVASILVDSLAFTATAMKPTATCTVWQATGFVPGGIQMGQGIRCGNGVLKRLYGKTATSGSIQAPTGSDPSVSARSSFLGDPLAAGQHRYYFVSYRDPSVLGGCSALFTFNVSQMLDIVWMP